MLDDLRRLLELQRLDDELIAYEKEQSELPTRRARCDEARAASEAALASAREALQAAEVEQRQSESALQDQEALLQKLEGQQLQVKSNEAYTALLSEMEHARQAISDCETRILEAMDAIESARAGLAAAEEEARATGARADGEERELDARAERVEKEIARLRADRERRCAEIDPALLERYSRIASRRRPAVVVVSQEICMGCRVDIPPQSYIEILRGEVLVSCNHCQRMLVHDEHLGAPSS